MNVKPLEINDDGHWWTVQCPYDPTEKHHFRYEVEAIEYSEGYEEWFTCIHQKKEEAHD